MESALGGNAGEKENVSKRDARSIMWPAAGAEASAKAANASTEAADAADQDGFGELDTGYSEENDDATEDTKRTTKKKSKGGRIASEITREELSECFGMPSEEAARRLGVGLTVLKRICRKFGVPRWPYRKLKSLDRLITNVENGSPPGDTYKHLMKSADEIREHQRAMCQGTSLELDDKTKKLQQAYSKFNHKQRKAQREDDEPSSMHGDLTCSGGPVHGAADQEQHQAVAVNGPQDQQGAAEQLVYMSLPGLPFMQSMPMMVVDPTFIQPMVAHAAAPPSLGEAQSLEGGAAAAPASAAEDKGKAPADPQEAGSLTTEADAALAASQMAAASAAAWGQYTGMPMPAAAAEAAAAYWKKNSFVYPETWPPQQQPQAASTSEDPATAAATAAAASSYYMHPMAASYMPVAAAAQQAYQYAYAMPGYIAGYDPTLMMQQYYQQMWRPAAEADRAGAAAASSVSYMQQAMPGMVPVAPPTDAAAGVALDPTQAAALAAQHAAYYAHYASQSQQWAAQAGQVMPQMQMQMCEVPGMPGVTGMMMVPAPAPAAPPSSSSGGEASQTPQQAAAPQDDTAREPDGKRKRRPNSKYGGDFTKGDELDKAKAEEEVQQKEEPADSVAHTLMHMAGGGTGSHATPAPAETDQQPRAEVLQVAAVQPTMQMPGMMMPGVMMYPTPMGWTPMMPGAMQVDMSGGKGGAMAVDMSMYYPMMQMAGQHGFAYPGMSMG